MTTPRLSVYDPDFSKYPILPVTNTVICVDCNEVSLKNAKNLTLSALGETAAAYVKDIFLLAGGRTSDSRISKKAFISNDSINWREIAEMPRPRARHAAVSMNDGSILIIGGITLCENDGCLELARDILKYNPGTDSWNDFAELPKRSSKLVAEIVGNSLFVISGDTGPTSEPEQPVYPADCRGDVQILNLETKKWSIGMPKPTPETGITSAVLDKEIFVVSSEDVEGRINPLVEVYNTKTNTWRRIPNMPTPRTNVPCGFINGKLYCVNGLGRGKVALSLIEVYNPKTNEWVTLDSAPPPCHSAGYVVTGENKLVIIGGRI